MRSFKLISAVVIMIFFTTSVVYAKFNNIKGWNYTDVYFSGVSGETGRVSGIDIDGEVGHPVFVNGPRANCQPGGDWSLGTEVSDGELPPGLTKGSGGTIEGIPTSRGHWIVEMRAYNLKCQGNNYMGFSQQLRFHISGSGRVIQ